MSRGFQQNGIAQATQFGKDGCHIRDNPGAPSGQRLEARTPDLADPCRMAGAAALEGDDFATLSQVQAVATATQVSATAAASTGSGLFVLIPGMTITPPAGTYFVSFSAQVTPSLSAGQLSLYAGGVLIPHSERNVSLLGGQASGTQAIITVNGVQAIEARYQNPGLGTIQVDERSLIAIRVN